MDQPRNGFRFSADSLLLACFAPRADRVLDIGTGCGVVGLAYLLRHEGQARVVGLDSNERMISCATRNAVRLGFEETFKPLHFDITDCRTARAIKPETFDLVLMNPPYREPGTGRLCADEQKRAARFETLAGLGEFLDLAAFALMNGRPLCLVYAAEGIVRLFEALRERRLEPKRMVMVHGHADAQAKVVLVEARKNGRPGLIIPAPLILYAQPGERTPTPQALSFCPFIDQGRREESAPALV
jgi:tRNA1Val (adenine37-N6)-methyltransferase